MTVTVLIPTIGRPSVTRAIESVLNQTIPTPFVVGYDDEKIGAGPMRNRLAVLASTPWVGFLDDDDHLAPLYHEWLRQELELHDPDVVVFKMNHPAVGVIPVGQAVRYGNVGISFALRRDLLLSEPFIKEYTDPLFPNEDYELLHRLEELGARIHFSDRIAYLVRHAN